MNTSSNTYTIVYASILVIIVAFMLAFLSSILKERQDNNVRLDKKRQILSSLNINTRGQDIAALYNKYIKQDIIINSNGETIAESGGFDVDVRAENARRLEDRRLPVYIAEVDGNKKYILPVRGKGLFGGIWGFIALEADRNTIFGTFFSHDSETPGLGAEIAGNDFQNRFIGKHILNESGKFVSVAVKKAGQFADGQDQVDALTGGTITSNRVSEMLESGLGQYAAFLSQK